MSAKANINIVVNSPAGAADLTRPGGGRVLVTGDPKGFLRPKVKSIVVKPFIKEVVANISVTATASPAANTTYSFLIEQESAESQQNNTPKRHLVQYVAPTGVTATILGNALAAIVQGFIDSGELEATSTAITSGNGGVAITGVTGKPLVKVIQPASVTVATLLANGASSGNLSASGTTITMAQNPTSNPTTLSPTPSAEFLAFQVGQLVKLSGWTGTAVINGKTAAQGVILRVATVTSNTNITFVAQSITGSISAAVTNFELIASEAEGLGSDLIAERGIVGQNADIVAATVYHEVVVDYLEPSGSTMTVEDGAPITKHYFIDATNTPANGLALLTQFGYVKSYLNSAGSAADPLLL